MTEEQKHRKLMEVSGQIDELTPSIQKTWRDMAHKALYSGALSEDQERLDNYLLFKAVIDIWCQERPYRALDTRTQREVGNLAHYI